MLQNPAPIADALIRSLRTAALLLLICAPNSGCINAGVMFGKVFFGNPMVKSAFEARTGVSLLEEDRKGAVVGGRGVRQPAVRPAGGSHAAHAAPRDERRLRRRSDRRAQRCRRTLQQ